MALSESVLSELLDAFRAGEGVDLVRDAERLLMQELIEVEATEQIGAGRYERAESRVTERNGSRPKLVATHAGDVDSPYGQPRLWITRISADPPDGRHLHERSPRRRGPVGKSG